MYGKERLIIIIFAFVALAASAHDAADTHNFVKGETTVADDSLTHDLDEVVVTGARAMTDIRHLPLTVNQLTHDDLARSHNTSILPTVTQMVPGVFNTSRGVLGYGVSGGGSGGISVRGLGSGEGRMMVLIDGHPQYSGIYGHAIADSYQTMMADRVEVLRGPASVIYGSNAMGGVINIVTHGAHRQGVYTTVNLAGGSYGTAIAEVSNNVHSGRFDSNVAAQYSRSDNHRPHMGFEQYSGHVNLGYRFDDRWRVYADADVSHFNASNPGEVTAPMLEADQWITRGVVNAGVENDFGPVAGSLTVYSNFGRHKINDGYAANGGAPQTRLFRSNDALTGVNFFQHFSLMPGNRITVGVDYQHIFGHAYYTSRATGEVLDTPNKQSGRRNMDDVAGYANVHHDFTSWLTADAGVRYDYHSVAGGQWVPQGGVALRPDATSTLKAMVSKGYRNPTMREIYLYPPSNDELRPERIVNYEISWHQTLPSARVRYGVNVFYLNGDNLIQTVNRQNVNTGRVENWGAEVEAAWQITQSWQLSTNQSWLHMVHPLVAAPQYKGVVAVQYSRGRLSVNADVQQIAGLYTVLGSSAHSENFTLVNLGIDYQLTPAARVWVRGDNLLAQRYEINAGYPMPRATFMAGIRLTL